MNVELDTLHFGAPCAQPSFPIRLKASVMVGDPSWDEEDRKPVYKLAIKPGLWRVQPFRQRIDAGEAAWEGVCTLLLTAQDVDARALNWTLLDKDVPVGSGRIAVFPADLAAHGKRYCDFLSEAELVDTVAGIDVHCASGRGYGNYPLYLARLGQDIVGIRLDFIEEGDLREHFELFGFL